MSWITWGWVNDQIILEVNYSFNRETGGKVSLMLLWAHRDMFVTNSHEASSQALHWLTFL